MIFVRKFLDNNPLIVCSEELQYIKKKLLDSEKDELKVKQRAGVLSIRVKKDRSAIVSN